MVFFIALLLVGLAYLWRNKALDWSSGMRRRGNSESLQHEDTEGIR